MSYKQICVLLFVCLKPQDYVTAFGDWIQLTTLSKWTAYIPRASLGLAYPPGASAKVLSVGMKTVLSSPFS